MKQEKPRVSRDAWVTAAYGLLLAGGVDAVKVMPLAKTMKTSRTSFYWLFKDREDVLEALMQRWEAQNTPAIVQQSERPSETLTEAMFHLFDCWLDTQLFDSDFEHAVRSWSQQDDKVAERVRQADAMRLQAIADMFMRFGLSEEEADVRARTVYLIQIGYISMRVDESLATRLQRIPHYAEIFTGQPCDEAALARFIQRYR